MQELNKLWEATKLNSDTKIMLTSSFIHSFIYSCCTYLSGTQYLLGPVISTVYIVVNKTENVPLFINPRTKCGKKEN